MRSTHVAHVDERVFVTVLVLVVVKILRHVIAYSENVCNGVLLHSEYV
jgi:hypothetical protein